MARASIPFLWINPGRRAPAAYFRRGRVTIRIRDAAGKPLMPGQPGFLAAFGAISDRFTAEPAKAPSGPPEGSLAAMIVAYRSSPEWLSRAAGTREAYGVHLNRLRDNFGQMLVKQIPREFVFELRDAYAVERTTDAAGREVVKQTPSRANHMVAVLRLVMAWGVNRGWRGPNGTNPAIDPGQLEEGPGFATWTPDEYRRFMDCPGVHETLKRAAALGYHTGQRKQDCLTVTKVARADGGITFVPAKTKRKKVTTVWVPEDPELTAILDAAPASFADTLLTRQDGKPWRLHHFNHAFVAAIRLAGLPAGHGFHGLRKAMSANLASSGATDAEIDAVVYHSDPKMTRLYRADAGQRALAKAGMAKLSKGKT